MAQPLAETFAVSSSAIHFSNVAVIAGVTSECPSFT